MSLSAPEDCRWPATGRSSWSPRSSVRKGFDEAIEVSLPYLPPGVEMDGPAIVPAGQTEAVLRLFARPDADPASWRLAAEARPAPPRRDRREMTLALMAQHRSDRRRRRPARPGSVEGLPQVASRSSRSKLAPATISGRFEPAAAEQGKTVIVACTFELGLAAPGDDGRDARRAAAPGAGRTGRVAPGYPPVRVPGLGRRPTTPSASTTRSSAA